MKIDKVQITKMLSSLMVVLVFVLSSCTKDLTAPPTEVKNTLEVRVAFPLSSANKAATRVPEEGTDEENRLDRVTILVFNGDGTKLENVLSVDVTAQNTASLSETQPLWESDKTLIIKPVENPVNPKKVYAIANWNKTTFDVAYTEAHLQTEFSTITTVSDINGASAYPMLMSGSKNVPSLTATFYNVTVEMARQVSKFRAVLTMSTTTQNDFPNVEWLTEQMKITMVNVPNKSYIIGRALSPLGITGLESDEIAVDDAKPGLDDQTKPASKILRWEESIYINENPITGTGKNNATYIVMQLPYKNKTTNITRVDNYYKLYIDTRDTTSPYKLLRNTVYQLNISILGLGLPYNDILQSRASYSNINSEVNIECQLTVLPLARASTEVLR